MDEQKLKSKMNLEKPSPDIFLGEDKESDEDVKHYGTPRHSGRYPWGSGDDPYQRTGDFLSRVDEMKAKGMSQVEIANALGMSTTQFRAKRSIATEERRKLILADIKSLQKDGLTPTEIGRKLGMNESSVRSALNYERQNRLSKTQKVADNLETIVKEKGMIDVGTQSEKYLGVSREKLNSAIEILKEKGYNVYSIRVEQATNKGNFTTVKVLCPPGVPYSDAYKLEDIHGVEDFTTRDGGQTLEPSFRYPTSISSKRVAVRYGDQGGAERDGLIEIRPGVKDLSLNGSAYSQVRIMVDGTHYLKGMAVYSSDLPKGADIRFNTSKKTGTPLEAFDANGKPTSDGGVLKAIKKDPDNPFGSAIKEVGGQSYYDDPNGKYTDPMTGNKQSLSAINKRSDAGDWGDWSHELPSQFLSKQPKSTIKKQILQSEKDKQDEYNEIMSLTNPTIKRHLLESYADDCDAASVSLKAAAFPGQKYKVILPVPSLKDDECYNPDLSNGRQVALIRFPHGGTFEIPVLTVNNDNKEAQEHLGKTPSDAIGITAKAAAKMSGADFDGDTVICIPLSDNTRVNSSKALKGLENFDPGDSYGPSEIKFDKDGTEHAYRNGKEYKIMSEGSKQKEMGQISNLITDMTLRGATDDEIARAVRHSMVVIDAVKHKYDYKQSYIDNNIAQLKAKYQSHYDPLSGIEKLGGASTLISQASADYAIPERKPGEFYRKDNGKKLDVVDEKNKIYIDRSTGEMFKGKKGVGTRYADPKTGELLYHDTNRTYYQTQIKVNGTNKTKTVSAFAQDGKYYYKDPETEEYVQITDPKKIISKKAMMNIPKMNAVKDAHALSSGTPQEELYADYANYLKALALKSRKESMAIEDIPYSRDAAQKYATEVQQLKYKLNQSELNAPRERQAQVIAQTNLQAKRQADPNMTNEEYQKLSQKELMIARRKVGAKRHPISITDNEWAAIQAGAISTARLKNIMKYVDDQRLKQLALPRTTTVLSPSKVSRMKAMASSGLTTAEIADTLNVSPSTVTKYLSGKE